MIAGNDIRELRPTRGRWLPAVRALRPHQWSKNLLVFVPAFAGHRFSVEMFALSALAFLCFCAAASSGYLVNDVLDEHVDRVHATKSARPVASGALSTPQALVMATALAIASLAGAA